MLLKMKTETHIGSISLIDNEIVLVEFKPNVIINLDQAKEMFQTRINLNSSAPKQLLLADFTNPPRPNIEARNFGKSEEAVSRTKAMAILSNNFAGIILGKFFLGLNKTGFPTKLFSNKEKAIKWLLKQ